MRLHLLEEFPILSLKGEHIQEGYRSLAYTLSFRSHEGTLVDADIEDRIQAMLAKLADKGCTLR